MGSVRAACLTVLLALGAPLLADVRSASAEDSPAAPVRIELRPKAGDTLRFRYRRAERSVVAPGEPACEESRECVAACTVVEAPAGGGAVLELTMESAKGRVPGPSGASVDYDTASPVPADEDARLVRLSETFLVGAKVRVTLDARGAVVRASGAADAARRAFAGTVMADNPRLADPAFDVRQVEYLFIRHPSPPRAPGAAWTDRVPGRMGELTFEGRPTSTMREPTADAVTVESDWNTTFATKDGRGTRTYAGAGTDTWSRADGFVVVSEVKISVRTSGDRTAEGSLEQRIERLATAAVAAPAPAGPAVRFGISAPPGTKVSFRYVRTSASNVAELGQARTDDLTREYTVSVKSRRADGGVTADLAFGAVSGRFDADGAVVAFDSARPGPLPEGPVGRLRVLTTTCLAGKTVEADLDASGRPVAVRGAKELVHAAVRGRDFGPLGDATALLDDAAVLEIVSEGFVAGPDGERATGSSWTVPDATRRLGALPVGFDETFAVTADSARATLAETYVYRPAKGAMPGLRAEGSGRSVWNRADGFAESVSRSWKTTGRGKFTVDATRTERLERIAPPGGGGGAPAPKPGAKPAPKPAPKAK